MCTNASSLLSTKPTAYDPGMNPIVGVNYPGPDPMVAGGKGEHEPVPQATIWLARNSLYGCWRKGGQHKRAWVPE